VPVTIAAGTLEEVVIVLPLASVVVTATSTLVGAVDWKAEVVCTTTLPSEFVDETSTGTRTPVAVSALDALTVGAVIAAGVLTTVLPASFVVVTGDGVLAAMVDETTSEVTEVLPAESVVVIGTVVPPLVLPIELGKPCS
jgi:hypothetical protein